MWFSKMEPAPCLLFSCEYSPGLLASWLALSWLASTDVVENQRSTECVEAV